MTIEMTAKVMTSRHLIVARIRGSRNRLTGRRRRPQSAGRRYARQIIRGSVADMSVADTTPARSQAAARKLIDWQAAVQFLVIVLTVLVAVFVLSADIRDVRADVRALRADMRADVAAMRADVKTLQADLHDIESRLVRIETKLEDPEPPAVRQ